MRMGGKEELGRGNAEWAKKAKPRKRERKEGAACAGNFFLQGLDKEQIMWYNEGAKKMLVLLAQKYYVI